MRGGTSSIGLEKCTHPPDQRTTAPTSTFKRRCARGAAVPARFCDRSEALVPAIVIQYAAYNTGRPPTWEIQRRDRWSHCAAVRWILRDPAFLCAETATLPQSLRHSGHDESSGSISGTATEVYLPIHYTIYTCRKVRANILNSCFQ